MTDESNWVLFEGSFAAPAETAMQLMAKAIPVHKPYGKPMVISHEAMSFRLISAEEMAGLKVRTKMLTSGETS